MARARRDGGFLRSFPPSDNTRRGSHSGLGPWRKGQDSNLLPSPVLGAAHPHELPFRRCRPLCYDRAAMKLIRESGIEPPFRRTLWPMSYHRGDYSDAPAGKIRSKNSPGPGYGMPRIMPRGSEAFTFSQGQL